jgi:predicted nucleic acid-binding protein
VQNPVVYLDSMVFIYAVKGDDNTAPPTRELMAALRQRPGPALTSELSLAEVLAPASANIGPHDSDEREKLPFDLKRRLYLNLMILSGFLALAPVTRDILIETSELRRTRPHKLPDAIHVATAIYHGCGFIVSADRGMRAPEQITKLAPDQTGISRLMRAFA